MDPGELNADKVPRRYDGMKPEIGNKSYMDGRTGGTGGKEGGGDGPFLRRRGGTSRDTKDVSKTTDAQYNDWLRRCSSRRRLSWIM